MNARDIKIARSIKRQKKAGKTHIGSVDKTIKDAESQHKAKFMGSHKDSGGIHRQYLKSFKNIHAK